MAIEWEQSTIPACLGASESSFCRGRIFAVFANVSHDGNPEHTKWSVRVNGTVVMSGSSQSIEYAKKMVCDCLSDLRSATEGILNQ